ncbi:hypothetical protein F5884DRAFT_429823 [Xylogone sp. PMI_703]|nr:hypothetical protein F5884DRAFT_429823 [Xylogone sp. PMI_703]
MIRYATKSSPSTLPMKPTLERLSVFGRVHIPCACTKSQFLLGLVSGYERPGLKDYDTASAMHDTIALYSSPVEINLSENDNERQLGIANISYENIDRFVNVAQNLNFTCGQSFRFAYKCWQKRGGEFANVVERKIVPNLDVYGWEDSIAVDAGYYYHKSDPFSRAQRTLKKFFSGFKDDACEYVIPGELKSQNQRRPTDKYRQRTLHGYIDGLSNDDSSMFAAQCKKYRVRRIVNKASEKLLVQKEIYDYFKADAITHRAEKR